MQTSHNFGHFVSTCSNDMLSFSSTDATMVACITSFCLQAIVMLIFIPLFLFLGEKDGVQSMSDCSRVLLLAQPRLCLGRQELLVTLKEWLTQMQSEGGNHTMPSCGCIERKSWSAIHSLEEERREWGGMGKKGRWA